jgi:hypothetical protein
VDKEVHLYNDVSQTPQLHVSGTLNWGDEGAVITGLGYLL